MRGLVIMATGTEKKQDVKQTAPRRAGRPPKNETERIRDKILDVATVLFFAEGYGAASIEAIARRARVSKRTIYHRFQDKPAVFRAVVHRIVERLRPPDAAHLFEGSNLGDILHAIARAVLQASLSPQALSLHRIILAEATRFPELALIVNEQGTRREAITRIAGLLDREKPGHKHSSHDMLFAAEQFLQMVIAVPQRRAMGLGKSMGTAELDTWAKATVSLFLRGYQG